MFKLPIFLFTALISFSCYAGDSNWAALGPPPPEPPLPSYSDPIAPPSTSTPWVKTFKAVKTQVGDHGRFSRKATTDLWAEESVNRDSISLEGKYVYLKKAWREKNRGDAFPTVMDIYIFGATDEIWVRDYLSRAFPKNYVQPARL